MSSLRNVAIVGATGAVGQELMGLLDERKWDIGELKLLASARSAGKELDWRGGKVVVEELTKDSFEGVDVALFSAGSSQAKEFAGAAVDAGAVVVDNSSAFRMDEEVPLVVPEVNADHVGAEHKIIANPNCSTIIMLMAVAPLKDLGVKRVIVSTYQSASGAGAAAMDDLLVQTKDALEGNEVVPKILPHVYAFNLFSHDSPMGENGYNEEERKMVEETRKILGDPEMLVNPTCIRVPVLRAHSESITLEFEGDAPELDVVRERLAGFAGVSMLDDREANRFPMPLDASGKDDVFVGRIRHDISNPKAISLFVCGDQIRKGAALNAVQIAENLFERGLA